MRQIIKTKYLGPTNFRGSRIRASCEAGSVTLGWKAELSVDVNHKLAIETLQRKLGWDKHTQLVFGWDKHSLVAVQIDKEGSEK